MIRPLQQDDIPTLVALTADTGMFRPHEVDTLEEVFADYFTAMRECDHQAYVWQTERKLRGFVYYAPAPMTDRTWYLWWIVVAREHQRQGLGSRLLQFVEQDLRCRGARLLLIETSSQPAYAPTRAFYLKHGYQVCATVSDFYADGDSLVIFARRFTSPHPPSQADNQGKNPFAFDSTGSPPPDGLTRPSLPGI
jgi:ribosomal protein S18 acetylase RimI-like enzyme